MNDSHRHALRSFNLQSSIDVAMLLRFQAARAPAKLADDIRLPWVHALAGDIFPLGPFRERP